MFHRWSYVGRLEHRAFHEEAKWERMCHKYGEREATLHARHQKRIAEQRKRADLAKANLDRYMAVVKVSQTKDDAEVSHVHRRSPRKTAATK